MKLKSEGFVAMKLMKLMMAMMIHWVVMAILR